MLAPKILGGGVLLVATFLFLGAAFSLMAPGPGVAIKGTEWGQSPEKGTVPVLSARGEGDPLSSIELRFESYRLMAASS